MHQQYLTVSDLLKDESFINYCRRQNERDVLHWEKFIADNPGKKQLIEEARQEYALLFTALANADLEEQMQKLRLKMEASDTAPIVSMPKSNRNFFSRFRHLIGTAAILILAAGYFLWKKPEAPPMEVKEIAYASNPGERKSFQLPDGTQVSLNAGSTITVSEAYGKQTRDVYLKGEAFFEVQHNKHVPFIVHTSDMEVKALGTAFNVRSYSGEKSETALLHGLVEVTLKKDNNRKVLLHPDEKISWSTEDKNAVAASSPPAKKEPVEDPVIKPVRKMDDGSVKEVAWMENKLAFDDDAFEDIVPQLARWYNVEISFGSEEVKHYHFTATFKKEKLEQVLDILRASKRFKYHYEGKSIVISK